MPKNKPTIPTPEGQPPPPCIYVYSADTHQCMRVPLKVQSVDTGCPLAINALLDSGAIGMFIDIEFVWAKRLKTRHLPRAIPVYNIDGTPNEAGSIKEEVYLICTYGNHTERATFSITSLGHLAIILGHTWLTEHNPEVNWSSGEVSMTHCPESCGVKPVSKKLSIATVPDIEKDSTAPPDQHTRTIVEEPLYPPEDGDRLFVVFVEDNYEEIGAGSPISQQLAQNASEPTPTRSLEDLVAKPYQEFKDVFSKESFDKLPPRKPWDHAIEQGVCKRI